MTTALALLSHLTCRGGTKFHLNLCVSYGGRGEIVNACKRSVHRVPLATQAPPFPCFWDSRLMWTHLL